MMTHIHPHIHMHYVSHQMLLAGANSCQRLSARRKRRQKVQPLCPAGRSTKLPCDRTEGLPLWFNGAEEC